VFFVANFSHFAKNILKKEYSVTKSVFLKKIKLKSQKSPKMATTAYKLQHEAV